MLTQETIAEYTPTTAQSQISYFSAMVRDLPADFLPEITEARIHHLQSIYF